MSADSVSEYGIGPYDYDEAVAAIQKFAMALTNLGLANRFAIAPTPRSIIEYEKRSDGNRGRKHIYFQAILIDKCPHLPKPEGLTALGIRQAESQGYKQPKVKQYEAFGERKTLNQWAKVAGTSWPTLKSRIDAGMTMEEAITDIALKKSA